MANKFVPAWDTRTGVKRLVPEHWFDHEDMSANLSRTDPGIPVVAPAGVNSVARPDQPDYAVIDSVVDAVSEELKGKALDDALDAAGLPKTGSADEKRARLAEHDDNIVDPSVDPMNSNTGEPTDTPPLGGAN